MPPFRVVAHRGYAAVAPENTLPALAAAVLAGADLVEFDVRGTADGVPVVIHDPTVDRTTNGTGPIAQLTWRDVNGLDAGSWFSPAFAGLRVPTLDQVLALLAPSRAELLLEIKPPATVDQVKVVVALVGERGLSPRTVVQSFDPAILHMVTQVAPHLRRGLLRNGLDADPVAVVREVGAAFYNPSIADVLGAPAVVGLLHQAGVEVMPWTANDPTHWPTLLSHGVAGLITDRAGELAGWRHGGGRGYLTAEPSCPPSPTAEPHRRAPPPSSRQPAEERPPVTDQP